MTQETRKADLSVVVLCYRSEEAIISFISQMEDELRHDGLENYELVLVANFFPGLSDRTPEIVRRMAAENPRVVPVTLEKQGMMGWDVISGFRAATGDAVALIDGDGQMPARDIVRLWHVLKSGEFDFVKTFRSKRLDGVQRIFVSRWYNLMFHTLFPGRPFRDINSKPKLITHKALDQMRLCCPGWFSDGEIMLEVSRLDLSFAEVPTVFHRNEWRASFVNWSTVIEMVRYMIEYRIRYWKRR